MAQIKTSSEMCESAVLKVWLSACRQHPAAESVGKGELNYYYCCWLTKYSGGNKLRPSVGPMPTHNHQKTVFVQVHIGIRPSVSMCVHVVISLCPVCFSSLAMVHHSASTSNLVAPPARRASIRNRAFAVAGPRTWNSLPPALRSTSKPFST